MARYVGAVCRLCRRENRKMFLKGERCFSEKCSIARRNYGPGQNGQSRKKFSEYGIQLRAKQLVKRYYGVLERQFLRYFNMAERMAGMAGENLLKILESRLDNVVYRAGFASSRAEARQLVLHNHFTLNGEKVNISSIILKPGSVIQLKDKSAKLDKFKSIFESFSSKPVPMWLNVDKNSFKISVERFCEREEVELEVAEHLIVELYSK